MQRFFMIATVCLVASFAQSAVASTVFTVNSGRTQVNSIVTPFETALTGDAFYNLANDEANPLFDLAGHKMHVYLHQTIGASDVSIGFIFNTNKDGVATRGGGFEGRILGALASATSGVEDDGVDQYGWDSGDLFDGSTSVNGDFDLGWAKDFTDGFTINTSIEDAWSISINASMINGITDFVFLTGDLNAPTSLLIESPEDTTLRISSRLPLTAVPLPAGLPLLAGAVMVLTAMRRRRR